MYKPIKLTSLNDVQKLYKFAISYDGDVYISTDTAMLNARSLLGMASLVGKEGLKIVFPDHTDPNKVVKAIHKLERSMA